VSAAAETETTPMAEVAAVGRRRHRQWRQRKHQDNNDGNNQQQRLGCGPGIVSLLRWSHTCDHRGKAVNSLTAKSCYGGEKHRNPVGFYSRNSTESTLQHKHNNHKHHHHGGAVCPSFGMGSMDPPGRTRVTSSEGVGRGGSVSVLIKSINF